MKTQKVCGTTVQWQIAVSGTPSNTTHTHTHTFCHWLRNTLTLSLISPVSLQWAHCSATPIAPHPPPNTPPPYNRISIAFLAAVCKRVSVCVCVACWLRPSKVIAMATCTWGPLAVLSQSTGHGGHMERGTRVGTAGVGGIQGGWRILHRLVDTEGR